MANKAGSSGSAGETVQLGSDTQQRRHRRGTLLESKPTEKPREDFWYGSDAEEYDFCEEEVPVGQSKLEVPDVLDTYRFPGTWDAAYHTTAAASKGVAHATGAYFSAVVSSGIGQASVAVSQAALATGNKAARIATKKAIRYLKPDLENRLPSFAKKWLNGPERPTKDNADEAKPATEGDNTSTAALDSFAIGDEDCQSGGDAKEQQETDPAYIPSDETVAEGREASDADDDDEDFAIASMFI